MEHTSTEHTSTEHTSTDEEQRREEIARLLATSPRLHTIFELFREGQPVPRQSPHNKLQRPTFCLVPDLKAQPWWEPSEFPLVKLLQREYSAIRAEVLQVLGVTDAAALRGEHCADTHPLAAPSVRTPLHEIRASVARGEWRALYLWREGLAVPAHQQLCPRTCHVLAQCVEGQGQGQDQDQDQSCVLMDGTGLGYVYFSLLQPGTQLQAHCGPTNLRLRVHLALSCDDTARITVNGESRAWCEGECLVFDDSFEHAVSIGTVPRLVLIVDLFHPHLTAHERRLIRTLLPDIGGD